MKSTKTWKVAAASFRVFPLVIADSERDMPGIEPGPLGWYTSAVNHWATRSESNKQISIVTNRLLSYPVVLHLNGQQA